MSLEENIDSLIAEAKYRPESFLKELKFTNNQYTEIKNYLAKMSEDNLTSTKKGEVLESFMLYIVEAHKLFEIKTNISTSTNEIDLLLSPTLFGKIIIEHAYNGVIDNNLIIECKNYVSKIDVTWVGKLASLLNITNTSVGIMMSPEGVTGRNNWDASKGLIRKIALKNNIYILDLTFSDINTLEDNTLLDVIKKKVDELKLDTDFSKLITSHSLEEKFEK